MCGNPQFVNVSWEKWLHVWVKWRNARTRINNRTAAAGILLPLTTLLRPLLPSVALNSTQSQQTEAQCRDKSRHNGPLLNHPPPKSARARVLQHQVTVGKALEWKHMKRCKVTTGTIMSDVTSLYLQSVNTFSSGG